MVEYSPIKVTYSTPKSPSCASGDFSPIPNVAVVNDVTVFNHQCDSISLSDVHDTHDKQKGNCLVATTFASFHTVMTSRHNVIEKEIGAIPSAYNSLATKQLISWKKFE